MNTPTPSAVYARMMPPPLTMQAIAATIAHLPVAQTMLAWGRTLSVKPCEVWKVYRRGDLRLPPVRAAA